MKYIFCIMLPTRGTGLIKIKFFFSLLPFLLQQKFSDASYRYKYYSVRKVFNISFCKNLVDFNEVHLHEVNLCLQMHV
jgi:hypothetical protein